jgi:hypothetical protein
MLVQLSYLLMERLSRDHLKDKEGWSHSHKGIMTGQDIMIEQSMSGAGKMCVEGPILMKERDLMYIMWKQCIICNFLNSCLWNSGGIVTECVCT